MWAKLLGHSPDTIKRAKGLVAGVAATSNGKVISDIENFMVKHRSDSFTSLPALIVTEEVKAKKGKGKMPIPITPESGPNDSPRIRVNISKAYGQFIDEYLDTFISLSGNAAGRKRLVTEIMKTAESRAESLQSTDVKADSVMKRLGNALAKKNRLEKQAAGLEDGNNDN